MNIIESVLSDQVFSRVPQQMLDGRRLVLYRAFRIEDRDDVGAILHEGAEALLALPENPQRSRESVADGTLQQGCIDLALNQVVRRPSLHCFQVYFAVSLTGEQDDRNFVTPPQSFAQQFKPAAFPKAVVEKTNVVLFAFHRSKGVIVVGQPLELEPLHLGEQVTDYYVVVLVVLDEEHFQQSVAHAIHLVSDPPGWKRGELEPVSLQGLHRFGQRSESRRLDYERVGS